jgi:CheY-like chemotaxis protein
VNKRPNKKEFPGKQSFSPLFTNSVGRVEKNVATPPVAVIVEDEFLVRMEMAESLLGLGWIIVELSSGEAAVAYLDRGGRADLLITDIRLTGRINGWDVAEHFRTANEMTAVIYCSGNPVLDERRVKDSIFVEKPFQTSKLLAATSAALEHSKH